MMVALHEHVVAQAHLLVRLLAEIGGPRPGDIALEASTAEIAEELFAGLEQMHRMALELEPSPSNGAGPVPADVIGREYRDLVDRIVTRVPQLIPQGSVVAVVTRGDAALLNTAGLTAWHFPQNDIGTWAGFHPATGADAVAQLVNLQRRGARYLVIPTPSSWWLEFYDEFSEHLRSTAVEVFADSDMFVFDLDRSVRSAPATLQTLYYYEQVERFTELVGILVPPSATVLVVSRGDDAFLEIGRGKARHFPASIDGGYLGHPASDDDAVLALGREMSSGARYLALPSSHRWWRDVYPGFCNHLRSSHRCVLDQAEIGSLYELIPAGGRPQ